MIEILLQAERALSVGLLDRAETLYSQVARADPQNAIAVVGLARVTLDRGDDVGALELARKAATIDPENPAARNMVTRLEEILDYHDATALLEGAAAAQDGAVAEVDSIDLGAHAELDLETKTSSEASESETVVEPEPVEPEAAVEPEPEAVVEPEPVEPEAAV